MNETTTPTFFTYTIANATIRCALIDGQRWFPVADVCKALGIHDKRRGYTRYVRPVKPPHKAVIRFPQPKWGRPSLSVVSEAGLHHLLCLRDGEAAAPIRQALLQA
ncbi:hypothetical protein BTN45_20350 [Rhizobium sp. ZX09]|nr:hypothetical protein BTN45_20350 [Rhizobium sp. ZX09]